MIFNMGALYQKPTAGSWFAYTGEYEEIDMVIDGAAYSVVKLLNGGTFSANGVSVDIWACGSGSIGKNKSENGYGGAGAYANSVENVALSGDYTVVIGANSGNTTFGTLLTAKGVSNSKSGGTGGGGCGHQSGYYTETVNGGNGDNKSKFPFGDESGNFYCHCAGAGASKISEWDGGSSTYHYSGGNGGTNGGKGTASKYHSTSGGSAKNGVGGEYGGGNPEVNNGNGQFYGAGASLSTSTPGPGVCYVRKLKAA